jgi:hypothetical protein
MKVIYTIDVVYGSYNEIVKVICDENDDMATIEARVRRQYSLNFLPMAYFKVKILSTEYLKDDIFG